MHRHSYSTRKLGRKSAQRKALMRGLATSVILYEKVKTTTAKAKEVQSIVEKLITTAKKGDLNAIRKLNTYIYGENAVQKLVTEIAPLYKERNGGYTRVVRTGYRAGDAAPMAIIELVDIDKLVKKVVEKSSNSAKASLDKKAKATTSSTSLRGTKQSPSKKTTTKKTAPKEKK